MGTRRIDVRGFTCAHRGSGGRAARIGGPAGEKLEQMWKTLAILCPHRSMVRPRQFLAGQGNSRPGYDVSVMTCWEHK